MRKEQNYFQYPLQDLQIQKVALKAVKVKVYLNKKNQNKNMIKMRNKKNRRKSLVDLHHPHHPLPLLGILLIKEGKEERKKKTNININIENILDLDLDQIQMNTEKEKNIMIMINTEAKEMKNILKMIKIKIVFIKFMKI